LYDKDIFLKENFREVSFCYGQNEMGNGGFGSGN
jgi:hypothetical protein